MRWIRMLSSGEIETLESIIREQNLEPIKQSASLHIAESWWVVGDKTYILFDSLSASGSHTEGWELKISFVDKPLEEE